MTRFATLLVASSFFASQALACGMYVPAEKSKKLVALFEEIDKAEAKPEAIVEPPVTATIEIDAAALDAIVEAAEAAVQDAKPVTRAKTKKAKPNG